MEVAGCVVCKRCPNLVIREVARRTGGLCGDCLDRVGAEIRTIEALYDGQRVKIRTRQPSTGSKGDRSVARKAEKARRRAYSRVARLFPHLLEVIVADERARAGLEPWPFESFAAPVDADELDQELNLALRTSQRLLRYGSADGEVVHEREDRGS